MSDFRLKLYICSQLQTYRNNNFISFTTIMKRILTLSAVCLLAMAFSSCGSKLSLDKEHFSVDPQILTEVGGKVDATVKGTFPEKSIPAKTVVKITPYIQYEGGQAVGNVYTLQGEKVTGNNQVIAYKQGGSFTTSQSFDYVPAMSRSELYIKVETNNNGKGWVEVAGSPLKLADGVISTEELATAEDATPALAADKFQRIIQEVTEANIMFLIQRAEVRNTELKTDDVKALANALAFAAKAEDREIANVSISSYASPDGPTTLNEKLASQREKNTETYLKKELKKSKLDNAIESEFTAEDWEGFKQLLTASNIQDKDLILRVLSMYSDPEKREAEIKNLSSAYKALAEDILPKLRRSKMAITVDVIGKSDDEIKALLGTPNQLSIDEILYAATLTNNAAEKEDIYKKAIATYPNDYRAYNNLGNLAYAKGDIKTAKGWYEKAYQKEQSKEVCLNLALIAMAEDADNNTVESYLNKAAGAEGYNEAAGLLNIKKGNYAAAVKSFGDAKTNNAALAQILAKDYNKAKATLAAVSEPNADTYYLQAINGARTNNKAEVIDGLKKAVKADPSYAKKAASDIEFAKYVTDSEFASIIG